MEEGTWESGGYRSTKLSAFWAQLFLGLHAGVGVAGVVLGQIGHDVFDRAVGLGGSKELNDWGGLTDQVAAAQFWLLVLTAMAFLYWEYRLVSNVPWLGGGTPHYSPGWSVAWWFIPIALLVMPYRVTSELFRRLAWIPTVSTRIVGFWWIAWIASEISARVGSLLPADDISGVHDFLNWLVISEALTVAAAVLGLLVVRRLEHFAQRRAEFAQSQAASPGLLLRTPEADQDFV